MNTYQGTVYCGFFVKESVLLITSLLYWKPNIGKWPQKGRYKLTKQMKRGDVTGFILGNWSTCNTLIAQYQRSVTKLVSQNHHLFMHQVLLLDCLILISCYLPSFFALFILLKDNYVWWFMRDSRFQVTDIPSQNIWFFSSLCLTFILLLINLYLTIWSPS